MTINSELLINKDLRICDLILSLILKRNSAKVKWEEKRDQRIDGSLFSRRINFVLCIPACPKEIGETLRHCRPKKRKLKTHGSIVGCVNVASSSPSSLFSIFLANRDIVYNIKIYDLGWSESESFLFSTSCLFLFFLQFTFFFILFYGSSCIYRAFLCAFL